MPIQNDPDNYHALSKPFSSPEEANTALEAFLDGLRELRKKHKIPDFLFAIEVEVLYPDGETGSALTWGHLGASINAEKLAAYAMGQASADRREVINKLVSGKGVEAPRRK